MLTIKLTGTQVTELATVLGAAEQAFREMSMEGQYPGIFRQLLESYADAADRLCKLIADQHNEQVANANQPS